MVRGGGDKTKAKTQVVVRKVRKAATDVSVRTETLFDFRYNEMFITQNVNRAGNKT
jgi:hypothetical protein